MPHSRRTRADWQGLVDSHHKSGLSARAFCDQHGVGYASFCQWRQRLSAPARAEEPAFISLNRVAAPPSTPWDLEVELGNGVVLRLRRGS